MLETNNIPRLLRDNDAAYLENIHNIILSIDNYSTTTVTQGLDSLIFRIFISNEILRDSIIKSIKKYHKLLGLSIYFSKSVNISISISYTVKFGK